MSDKNKNEPNADVDLNKFEKLRSIIDKDEELKKITAENSPESDFDMTYISDKFKLYAFDENETEQNEKTKEIAENSQLENPTIVGEKAHVTPQKVNERGGTQVVGDPIIKKNEELQSEKNPFVTLSLRVAYVVFVILSAILLSNIFVSYANDAFAFVKEDKEISVTIPIGSTTNQITKILHENGVIKEPFMFKLFTKIKKNDGLYKAGLYSFNSKMDYGEIMNYMKKQKVERMTTVIRIIEGWTLDQIVEYLVNSKLGTAEKYWTEIENGEFDYEFLKDAPKGKKRLEGYIFPDTYEVYTDEDEHSILKRCLSNFNRKFPQDLIDSAKKRGMTINQVVTLASIIEREAADSKEFTTVSSVFHNRLKNNSEYPFLQSCATVQYILPERKAVISIEDTKINNPYNTYVYKGLPLGPISNPSQAALYAAVQPDATDYYFFVVASDGRHIFSKTFSEHQKAIRKIKKDVQAQGTGVVS